jgi:gelsolin
MIKQKEYNIADSNIANLGTDLEKKVRQAAAEGEPAWKTAGKQVGLQIWRIEKFKVKEWPKAQYGEFFDGDSYIVLNTYKKQGSDKILWDVHFWLGKYTTQDEAGTAAYKTVELDDFLGGDPVQHREVQGYESDLFCSYFKNEIKLLSGGIDSGFNKVKPTEYKPRLPWIKGKRKIRVTQVDMAASSLNSGDVFILDNGLDLYQWNGKSAGPGEKFKGAALCRAIDDERAGKPTVHVIEESQTSGPDFDAFWKILGGSPKDIKSAEEGGSDLEADNEQKSTKKLFHLSDETGTMVFKEVGSGSGCKRSLLKSDDVFVFDVGMEVFAWVGKGASKDEKKYAMKYAQDYITKNSRPAWLPITRILEGGENEVFENAFQH